MTTLSYYMTTDCFKVRKQITVLNIYRPWGPYDVVLKQGLLDCMDKEIVEDFCCYRISLILQFTQYLILSTLDFLKRKWKWHTTNNIQKTVIILRHFTKSSSKSSDHSGVVSCV
jgi:hypothetical protein